MLVCAHVKWLFNLWVGIIFESSIGSQAAAMVAINRGSYRSRKLYCML
jgi:hypothetical protein